MDLTDILLDTDRHAETARQEWNSMRRDSAASLAAPEKTASVLTAKGRSQIEEKNFALPAQRKYPIHDLAHARNALTRVDQYGTPEEKAKVHAAVASKYPALARRSTTITPEGEREKSSAMDMTPMEHQELVGMGLGGAAGGAAGVAGLSRVARSAQALPDWLQGVLLFGTPIAGGLAGGQVGKSMGQIQGLADAEHARQRAEKTSGIERIAEMWKTLPPEAKAALIGAPIGAGVTGAGQYAASRPMMSGESREEISAKALQDKLQQLNEARGGGGYSGKTMEELAASSARHAEIGKEHPLKAALLASLVGAGAGAGTGALISRLR